MGVYSSSWSGSDFPRAIQRLPDVFLERTGLELRVEACGPTSDGRPSAWSLSVPGLHLRDWVEFYLASTSELTEPRVEGEWVAPLHPYVWYQLQACLAELGFRSVPARPTWRVHEQKVPHRWNRPWNQMSRFRRTAYGRPSLWPLWFF